MRDLRTTTPGATTARTAALAAAALGLLLTTTACGSDSSSTGADTVAPVAQVGTATPTSAPTPAAPVVPPTSSAPAAPAEEPALADGEHEVQVLSADADSVGLDLGRFVVGEPVEPGVDAAVVDVGAFIGLRPDGRDALDRIPPPHRAGGRVERGHRGPVRDEERVAVAQHPSGVAEFADGPGPQRTAPGPAGRRPRRRPARRRSTRPRWLPRRSARQAHRDAASSTRPESRRRR